MDLEHGLLMFFIGIPASVLILAGIIKFIGMTEKQNKEDEDETTNDIYKL
tara:strand:+ start:2680 stop:2829 length:150 start_codon:yes stop_codon:yes gene_type:complete